MIFSLPPETSGEQPEDADPQSVVDQINAVMKNRHRLVGRTQKLRGVSVLGHPDETTADYVFDDTDFYQQLVKDVVEKESVEKAVPAKKKERRAKDYSVIIFPKLENFMSPVPYHGDVNEVDRDVLIANLFK